MRVSGNIPASQSFPSFVHEALRQYMRACEDHYRDKWNGKNPEMQFTATNGITITVEAAPTDQGEDE